MSSSTEELDLLERVFLRIGSAESDEQLESAVNKFLIPVLLKLSSQNEGVRKKVMELLVHLNKRIKRRPTVQLPVEALLSQYRDPNASSFLINFSILYIKLGYPRLPLDKQEELAPILLFASERKPKVHQDSLLLLLTSVIGLLKVPADAEKRKEMFKLNEKPELMKNFSSFMLDVLLLPYVHISSSHDNELSSSGGQSLQPPPGMSEYGYRRVTNGETQMSPEKLEQTKLGIVKFLSTGVLSNEEIICHLIIAASDTRFTVANIADTELKRIAGSVDWSNTHVANRLFHIYLGTPEVPPEKRNLIPQANRVVPANTRIRLKILPYLSRLEKEAILFPASIQVIFTSLHDGNANSKLQLHALNFAMAMVRKADNHILNKMGGMLYTGLLKLVWNPEENQQLRIAGYTIIGEIIKKMPHIINKNLIELQVFFENLSCDQADIRMAVRDSLLTMIDAFKLFMKSGGEKPGMKKEGASNSTEEMEVEEESKDQTSDRELMMTALLSAQVESKEPMARFVAVKYIAAVFDSDHVNSRYLLLLAAGDSNSDVSGVTVKSLYAGLDNDERESKTVPLPDFAKMSQCIYERANTRLTNSHQRVNIQNVVSPFNEVTFNEILTYLRLCLAKSSSVPVYRKEMISHPSAHSPNIREYISRVHAVRGEVFSNYLTMVEMLVTPSCSSIPIGCLVEVVGTCPEIFAPRLLPKLELITNLLNNTKEDVREGAAVLLSILCVHAMTEEQSDRTIESLLGKLDSKSLETQHGAIVALGNIAERKLLLLSGDAEQWSRHREIALEIAKRLDSPYPMLISATCSSLGQMLKCCASPLPDEAESGLSKRGVMDKLLEAVNNPKSSSKIKEKAIHACGMMCLGENFPFSKELLENFLKISRQTKDIDTHFSIGESIIRCVEGVASAEKRDLWKVKESEYVKPKMSERNIRLLEWLLEEMIGLSAIPHPNSRQAVCVYLLSVIKNLADCESVKGKLAAIQGVFMELLSENNELVQDIASKGLALVYENTTEANKKELVTSLLDQLLSGKRAVQQVTKDTKLFEEGQLGATPSGGSLSTYKELCSLASELNQPDLIYKFMHLANHNAVWNSKKGAAFGFHTIASQANDQLSEYLPKMIPRLYRYQFDPTPRIQQSMANIWHSLVKDTQKTLDKYYDDILDDLLSNLTSNLWRVRISCCLALTDFFRGSRSLLDAKPKLTKMWHSLFRVMDDVHEGTRIAAQNTSRGLAKLCVKACDTAVGKVDNEMLQITISVFLSGITNTVAEVRSLCLLTISQLVNSAGSSLKPNLTTLILSLLEAAGELESLGLLYLSAQHGGVSQTQDLIDSVRASAAKSHFTTQTVTKCVQYVDVEMVGELVPKVVEIMKNVNLGSKVACAHLIVLLSHHLGKSMEPYVGKLLAALVNGLLDRNATVRKTYASTIGQILHVAKPSSLEKLFSKLSNWYFEKEDPNIRLAIGQTLQAAAHYNGELLKDYFSIVIPLIFFAMHTEKVEGEDNSHVVMWEDVWNEVSLGFETSIRQQMKEICSTIRHSLAASSWTTKAQAGRCIQTMAAKLGENMEEEARNEIIDISLTALQGKTFPGKENIVMGLAKISTNSANSLKENPEKCQAIVEALFRECGKSDFAYKRHSLRALGSVLEAFDRMDFFEKVYQLSKSMIQKLDEKEDEESSEDVNKLRNERYATAEVVYVAVGKSWPRNKETQLRYQDVLLEECIDALEKSPRDIQVAILSALHSYVDKLHYFAADGTKDESRQHLEDIVRKLAKALHFSLGIEKHTKLRKEALNVVSTLGKKLILTGRSSELKLLTDSLRDTIPELEKDTSPEVRIRLTDLKEIFSH